MSMKSCAICHRPQIQEFRPFCSQRCAQIDLGRWFAEGYAVPGEALDETLNLDAQKTGVDPGEAKG